MASVIKDPGGRRRIAFVNAEGARKAIRLGKISQRTAESIKTRVEQMLEAILWRRPMEADLIEWIQAQHPRMQKKLVAAGLIPQLQRGTVVCLGEFLDEYISKHGPAVKPNTIRNWNQCRKLLLEHFKYDTPLQEINEGRAIEWRDYLRTRDHTRIKRARKLEETTIRKRCGCARQFFEQAFRLKLIPVNPFKSKRIPTSLPKLKQKAFITPENASKVMEKLPSAEWQLLFALARWGGLRIPSEPIGLKWTDVDWGAGRIVVHSPKTEHHEGHEKRVIPLFPELDVTLRRIRAQTPPTELYVLPMLQRVTSAALRKPILKAIQAAGLQRWEKLFVALRATRDTELRERFPVHVVEAWLGHEDRVAKRNYTQVTDDHFSLANTSTENGSLEKAAQKAAQQLHEIPAQQGASDEAAQQETPLFAGLVTMMPHGVQVISADERT